MDSSSAPEQSTRRPTQESSGRKVSFGRALKRLRTALRIPSSSRVSVSPTPTPVSANPPETLVEQEEVVAPATCTADVIDAGLAVMHQVIHVLTLNAHSINLNNLVVDDEAKPLSAPSEPTARTRDSAQQERARQLFEKYGLDFELDDLAPAATSTSSPRSSGVLRVEKAIRMRVRYNCHRCQTTFGATPICSSCEHHRCKRCPRHPPKRARPRNSESESARGDRSRGGEGTDAAREPKRQRRSSSSPPAINMPRVTRSESDPQPTLMRRVPRICHKCQTTFHAVDAQICTGCGHLRCVKCSREHSIPANLRQIALGETLPERPLSLPISHLERPDRVFRKPRQRVRWICDQCEAVFSPDSKICSTCLHKRCTSCIRLP